MPKALLCLLDPQAEAEPEEEKKLRAAGFATATIAWAELGGQANAWMGLAEIIKEPGLCAWALAGAPENFTTDILAKLALLSLTLDQPPPTAFILRTDDPAPKAVLAEALPPLLGRIKIWLKEDPFAGRLMAARFKAAEDPPKPFHLKAHLGPLLGLWLELGPPPGEVWPGFMLAAVGASIDALGVGERGLIPKKSTLEYPMLNIEGELAGEKFNACAARNTLDKNSAAYIRLTAAPEKILVSSYPDGDGADQAMVLSLC